MSASDQRYEFDEFQFAGAEIDYLVQRFDLAASGDHDEALMLESLDCAIELQVRVDRAEEMKARLASIQHPLGFVGLNQPIERGGAVAVEPLDFTENAPADKLAQGKARCVEFALVSYGGETGAGVENADLHKAIMA
jgi:hypothetical protein